jgi:hypothetical protein
MYASFGRRTFYVFLSDQNDRPIPMRSVGVSSATLKKLYMHHFEAGHPHSSAAQAPLEQLAPVGEALLAAVIGDLRESRDEPAVETCENIVRLHHVDLWLESWEIRERDRVVAEARCELSA